MTISSSSHLAPDEVARHTFATMRKGFAPDEVRVYLESIAKGLRTLAEREIEFRQELEEAERRVTNPVINEETLTAALGQETARVLHSAHEASSEMLAKAELESDRLLTDARDEIAATEARVTTQLSERTAEAEAQAQSLRLQAAEEAALLLEAGRNEVEELVAEARSDCRNMIDEAQALRARVLTDLSKRRKVLHAQIEQLRAGRENLASTVRAVRRSIDTIADDLFRAEDDARLAAESAGRVAAARPDDGTPEEIAAALLAEEAVVAGALTSDEISQGLLDVVDGHNVPSVDIVEVESQNEETGGSPEIDPSVPFPSIDALFAKIRASREDGDSPSEDPVPDAPNGGNEALSSTLGASDVPEAAVSDEPPAERNPAAIRRDQLIEPLVKALARRMKRTLQDDQNNLLDRLRSNNFNWSIDILPTDPESHDAYVAAALPHVEEAAQVGAAFVGSEGILRPLADEMKKVAHDLAETVVGQLRRHLTDGEHLHGADESVVAEHVGAAFREWKGERIENLAGDCVVAAFSVGSLAAAQSKVDVLIEWVTATAAGTEPCPDCEDNVLNGPQLPGGTFPTGHAHPPAHPGCRCLLAPAAT